MFEQRGGGGQAGERYVDLQNNSGGDYGDLTKQSSSSFLSDAESLGSHPAIPPTNVDRTLYNDLVDLVPLVQTLIDRNANSSFTRRAPMVYTKTPSRDSLSKKNNDSKRVIASKSVPGKKHRDCAEKDRSKRSENDSNATDSFPIITSANMVAERDSEELISLRQEVDTLQRRLLEKDEILKAAENSKNQVKLVQAKYDDLKLQTSQKDSFVASIQQQLSDVKIKLADKQAALEKTRWEAMTSNQKVEKLQEEIDSMQTEMSSFMTVFDGLTRDDASFNREDDYDIAPFHFDYVPEIDEVGADDMLEMEEAKKAYLVALAEVKERPNEESLEAARDARLHLQSFVFRANKDIQ